MPKMQPIFENVESRQGKLFDRRYHFDYEFRPNIYSRTSRTATIARRRPTGYNQVLLSNRWSANTEEIAEEPNPAFEYTYGANFDTKFNNEFNVLPKPEVVEEKIDLDDEKKSRTPKPMVRRAINKTLPYKMMHRMRPLNRRSRFAEVEYLPPSNLIRLFGESSVPGVRDIALSRSFLRRVFWIGSFFFFGFLALRDISQLVSEYYTYPITVDVRLRDSRRLQFPAVTVCNLNIVRYSALCVANVSVIKDSMIPRDLREKLCGIQPVANPAPASTVSSTTPQPSATTTHSNQHPKKQLKPKKKQPTTTMPSRNKSHPIITTTLATTDSGDGLDDINNYGVMSKDKHKFNESGSWNETFDMFNRSSFEMFDNFTNLTDFSSSSPILEDIPGDIAAPIDVHPKKKPIKRSIKLKGKNGTDFQENSLLNSTKSPVTEAPTPAQVPSPIPPPPTSKPKEKNTETSTSQSIASMGDNNDIELTEREEKELQENLTNWLAVIYNSNEKIAKELGHHFEDLVLRCTIRSTNCTHASSFEQFFTPTEGNCYTFKSQKLRRSYDLEKIKDETSIAGVNYGLELVLNLEISEYLTGTAQIGAIVMIQHPDEIGNSASEAIFVAPQQSTYIGLKMVNISRLPKPYPEDCIDHWPPALVGRLTQNASYSQQACLKICLQRTIHTRCNCQSAMLPQLELNSTLKICDTRRKSTRNCVEEVMFQAEEKVSTCKCPPRCQVVNYDKTVSMTKWPTREDKVTFDRGKSNVNFQNLAKVTVYFQTMTCQEVRQEKAYTTAKLFSSLGGILGMYVGFSFLSVFEILEIFVRRFWYFLTKKRNRFRAAVHTITASLALNSKRPSNNASHHHHHGSNNIGYFNKSSKSSLNTHSRKECDNRYGNRLNDSNQLRI